MAATFTQIASSSVAYSVGISDQQLNTEQWNPSNFQSNNVYTTIASLEIGLTLPSQSGVAGNVSGYETGAGPVAIDLEFSSFDNGTSATTIVFPRPAKNVIHIISNNLNSGNIQYNNQSVTIQPTNGSPISGYIYLTGF
jgi:hypothetical protein